MDLEEILRTHRDAALRLLSENQDQVREGVELVVQSRMPSILLACRRPGEPPLTAAETQHLYGEVLTLAYSMFALGYSISKLQHHKS